MLAAWCTGGRWGSEGPSLVSSDLLPFPELLHCLQPPLFPGDTRQEAGRAPTSFHRKELKPREPANKPKSNPALDTGQTDAPNKDSQGLISKGLSLSEPACLLLIEWGCIWCLCWCQSWLVFFRLLITGKRELLLCLKRVGKKTPLTAYALWQH